jgi:hypothetical protein
MPNPVAVNDLSPISGSLQTSRISYGVETAGKNYGQNYNSTNWYSDIPNNGQFYTIISDNYTANYYVSRSNAGGAYVEGGLPAVDDYSAPVFWITQGTSSLDVITIVNGLPDRVGQTPFNSGSQALNWVASSSNYFAVGPEYYPQIDADNLILYLEGNQIISYPTTGSSWYDLSGNTNNGTLVNGPTWNSNGYIGFDGVDDYVNTSLLLPSPSTTPTTFNVVFSAPNNQAYKAIIGRSEYQSYGFSVGFVNGICRITYNNSGTSYEPQSTYDSTLISMGTFVFNGRFISIYKNSSLIGSFTASFDAVASPNPVLIANNGQGGWSYLQCNVYSTQIYNRALTQADVTQNYYGGPIVTSSLYSMLDASNLVSYPRTGTTAYTLTGSVNGTLTNGPSFTPAFGGGWVMDGVDDYLDTAVSSTIVTPTNNWTINLWCSLNSYPTISGTPKEGILFGHAYYGGLGIYAISSTTGVVDIYGYFRSDSSSAIFGSYQLTLNTPTMFTLTHEAGVGCKFYVNGQLNTSSNTTGGSWPNYMPNPFYLLSPQNGVYGGGANTYIYYPITTYSTQVYNNKTLTADEVLQNYNATK